MKEAIITIIGAVFNIVAVILNACGLSGISEVLYQILPYFNTLVIGVLWFFGIRNKELKKR